MSSSSVGPIRHVVNVRTLPAKGREVEPDADAEERAALARHLGVPEVAAFRADAEITPWRADGVRVTGRLRAALTQECVVTLDPLDATIDTPFEALFVPADSRLARPLEPSELVLDAEGDDPPDTFEGDTLDLGLVWVEHLVLALDPFPRKPGAELTGSDDAPRESPFAALAALRTDRGD